MKIKFAVSLICLAVLSWSANATVLYEDDFDSLSSPTFTPVFGSTQVVGPVLGNPTNSLAFNSAGNSSAFFYDQIRYPVDAPGSPYEGTGFDNFRLEFDIATTDLIGSNNQFVIFFDTPSVRSLTFGNDGAIRVNNPANPVFGAIGSYSDGSFRHVGMNFDIGNNQWDIFIDNALLYSGIMDADNLRSIRFSHGSRSSSVRDITSTTYIDNIVISAVPLPAAVWLFGTALIGLIGLSRRIKEV